MPQEEVEQSSPRGNLSIYMRQVHPDKVGRSFLRKQVHSPRNLTGTRQRIESTRPYIADSVSAFLIVWRKQSLGEELRGRVRATVSHTTANLAVASHTDQLIAE